MKKVVFLIVCFFCGISSSWALTLTCPEVASPGEIVRCHLVEENGTGLKVKYQLDSGITYQSLHLGSSWKSYYDGVDGFSIGNVGSSDSASVDIDFKIGMDVVVNKDYAIQLVEVEKSASDYSLVKLENVNQKIKIVSDVNTLDGLEISNGKLSPTFGKNVTSYKATVQSDKVVIKAVASDSGAKIEGDVGEKSLNYGGNTFVVKVISPRGNERKYSIYITRPFAIVQKDSDISLKSLSVSSGTLNFKADQFLYDIQVGYDVDNIEVVAVPNSEKAKVEIQKEEKLIVGENTINVVVTAEDGTVGTYVIIVNRAEKLSDDASIKSLVVKGYELDFKSDVYQYELEIEKEEKLDIEVELNDEKAKYQIKGNNNLKDKSVIEIVVTAEDGSEQSYQINIVKLGENTSSSILNYIKIVPLISFIILISIILIVKKLRDKVRKKNEEI